MIPSSRLPPDEPEPLPSKKIVRLNRLRRLFTRNGTRLVPHQIDWAIPRHEHKVERALTNHPVSEPRPIGGTCVLRRGNVAHRITEHPTNSPPIDPRVCPKLRPDRLLQRARAQRRKCRFLSGGNRTSALGATAGAFYAARHYGRMLVSFAGRRLSGPHREPRPRVTLRCCSLGKGLCCGYRAVIEASRSPGGDG